MRRAPRAGVLLALAAIAYGLAAWTVAPGFYDGFQPLVPYNWVSPPPVLASGNKPPRSGSGQVHVGPSGAVDPGSIQTQDGQAAIAFIQGAFVTPPDRGPVTVSVEPVTTFPDPSGIQLQTNVYCFTSTSPLAPGRQVLITLTYSNGVPAPSDVYGYQPGGAFQKLGNTGTAAAYSIAVQSSFIGCFGAGFPAGATGGQHGATIGGGQTLPIVAAVAIVIVLLAGIPLAVLRRRSPAETASTEEGSNGDQGSPEDGGGRRGRPRKRHDR